MTYNVLQISAGQMANFTYIIADDDTEQAAIIDPSWELDKTFSALKRNGWVAKYVINTHSHFDHVIGNEQVASVTGAKIVQHEHSKLPKDVAVRDGQILEIGKIQLRVVHTPGHSEDSICLVLDGQLVFTGDTLFVGNCGRIDLPGSDASKMYHSLFDVVSKLDERLVVYPGHDYGATPTSTIAQERSTNHVLQPKTKQEFLVFMGAGD